MNDFNYSKISYELTKKLDKEEKKNNGIFFTNPKTIVRNLKELEPYIKNIKFVLEPSCGSCEFINKLSDKYQNLEITGIELNKIIYDSIKSFENKNIKLYNENYMTFKSPINYDLIIGNPPYFVIKKKNVDKSYYKYFDGRPNIFILFLIKSLDLLNDNGILSFVLPKSFLNCLYYNKTREFIFNNFEILSIIDCDDNYIETKQPTIIFIIRKTIDKNIKNLNSKFSLNNDKYILFSLQQNIEKLKSLYNNSTTIEKMGFRINVGNIVWNQCKNDLTSDKNKTLLIYSSDIKNKKLIIQNYSNEEKKNYINKEGSNELLLVINRGYGVGNYDFNYCLIDVDFDYLIENHLLCIKYKYNIDKNELKSLYDIIINSFESQKTREFIDLYFGNNAINATELCEILPIYHK